MGSEVEIVAAAAGQGVAVATKCKTTPTPPSYGSVCLLCLRLKTCTSVKCDPEKHNQSRLACIKYVALVSRYLKLDTELSKFSEHSYWGGDKDFGSEKGETTTVSGAGEETISVPAPLLQNQKESDERNELAEEINKFVICDTCLPIANSFCESFQEYEYVRLKLHEKIYESTSLIKKSRSLDESIKVIRGIKRRLESEDCLTSFRAKLKIRGSEVIKDSIPRLRVARNKNADALAAKLKSKKLLFIDGKPKYVSPTSKTKSKAPALTQEPTPLINASTSGATSASGGNTYQASTVPPGTLYNSNSTVIVNEVPISFVTSTTTTSQVPQPHQTQAQEKLPIRFIHASSAAPTRTQNTMAHSNSNNKIPRNQNRKLAPVTLRKDAGGGFIVAITPVVDTSSRKRPAPVEPEPIFSSSMTSSSHITGTDTSSTSIPQQRKNLQGSSVTYQTIQTTKPTYSQSIVISSTTPTQPSNSNNVQVTSPPQIPSVSIQTCNINNCGTSFPLSEEGRFALQSHLATHKTLRCSICGADQFSPMELISHELEHETYDDNCISVTSFSGFKCPRCLYTSAVRSEYQEHFLEKHLNSKIKLLKCEECKKGFSYTKPKVYSNHILNCHPEGNESKSTCFKCNFCTAYFKKESMLWKHLKNDHRVNSKNGNFRCANCPKAYYMQKFLQLHQDYDCSEPQSEATKKMCPDSSCGAMFSTLKGLKKHIRDHGPDFKLPECPVCKVKFYENTTLKYHVITHNGEQVKLVFPEGSNIDPLVIPIETGISISSPVTVQIPTLPVVSSTESSSLSVSSPVPTPSQPTVSSQMQPLNVESTSQTFLPSSTAAVQSELVYPVIMSVSSYAPEYNNFYSTTSAWNQPSTHYTTCNSGNGDPSEFGPAVVHSATETVHEQKFEAKDEVLGFGFDEANVDESLQLGLFDQLISNVDANGMSGEDLIPSSWLVPDEFMMQ